MYTVRLPLLGIPLSTFMMIGRDDWIGQNIKAPNQKTSRVVISLFHVSQFKC